MKIWHLLLVLLAVPWMAAAGELVRVPPPARAQVLRRVEPEYPAEARARKIRGKVRFEAVIDRSGHVERLRLLSGHPLLRAAARKAARQWLFRPVIHNGHPERVATVLEIGFRLDHGHPGSGAGWTFELQCGFNARHAVRVRA